MTVNDTLDHFGASAASKAANLRENPLAFMVSALMAGAYVGIGILLILSVGQGLDPSVRPLVMGASFGIALTLVIFAGSELFTGHAMYMTIGLLKGRTNWADLAGTWSATWTGNLLGALGLAIIFVTGGGGHVLKPGADLLYHIAEHKIHSTPLELIARGMLCNWLVCLSIWTSARTKSDAAKCILIFWCLFAFIASGYEHSVANMTVFAVSLLSDHPDTISLAGAAHNLFWVTIGNSLSGALFMGGAYWLAAGRPPAQRVAAANTKELAQ